MWENLALSPVFHESLGKLHNLFQRCSYLIFKTRIRKPDLFFSLLLVWTCKTYSSFKMKKKICKLSDTKKLVYSSTLGKKYLYGPKEQSLHMN